MTEHGPRGTATRLRELPFTGAAHQALYRFDPPLKSFDGDKAYEHVVASASTRRNEVYLFGSDKDGKIADGVELPGSLKGTMDHSRVIALAGYKEVVMTEHELTEEKIAELHDEISSKLYLHGPWSLLNESIKDRQTNFARDAYDIGKQAAQIDDCFIYCEYEDIRKGDTVKRTLKHPHGTVVTTVGIADHQDSGGNWWDSKGFLIASDGANFTYHRRPAKISPPDPEKHPIILDEDGEAHWFDDGYYHRMRDWMPSNPEDFGNDWRPAKIVADTEED